MGVDVGNNLNRKNLYSYVSSAYNNEGKAARSIKWNADTPHGTAVKFQLRSADSAEELEKTDWSGPDGRNSYFETPGQLINNLSGSWIQYRAVFDMDNGASTPVLNSVEIIFEQ
jgi:hypothetical protein